MSLDVDPREVVTEPRRSPSQKNWRQAAWTEQMMRAVTSRFDSAMTYAPAVLAASLSSSANAQPEFMQSKVLFAAFEHVDLRLNGHAHQHGGSAGAASQTITQRQMMCLLLGTEDGYQVWNVTDVDNVTELLCSTSNRFRKVIFLKFLQHPEGIQPEQEMERPYLGFIADNKFYVQSVKEMKNPKHITWTESNKHILTNIDSNKRFVVVGHKAGIVILDAISYNMLTHVSTVKTDVFTLAPVFAVGPRWLAYASAEQYRPTVPSATELDEDDNDADSESVVSNIYNSGRKVIRDLMNYTAAAPVDKVTATATVNAGVSGGGGQPDHGTVRVVEVRKSGSASTPGTPSSASVLKTIAQFPGSDQSLSMLKFNPNGTLIAAAPYTGYEVNVFFVAPSQHSQNGSVQHLYRLSRGDTRGRIIDLAFNHGSRYVSFTSERGTTHVFPINPLGGESSVTTHTAKALEQSLASPMKRRGPIVQEACARIREPPPAAVAAETTFPFALGFVGPELEETLFKGKEVVQENPNRLVSHSLYQGLYTYQPSNGTLIYHELCGQAVTYREKDKLTEPKLYVQAEEVIEWEVRRKHDNSTVFVAMDIVRHAATDRRVADAARAVRWKEYADMHTHAAPAKPIWKEFSLHTFDVQNKVNAEIQVDDDHRRSIGTSAPSRVVEVSSRAAQPYSRSQIASPVADMLTFDGMQTQLVNTQAIISEDDINFEDTAAMVTTEPSAPKLSDDEDDDFADAPSFAYASRPSAAATAAAASPSPRTYHRDDDDISPVETPEASYHHADRLGYEEIQDNSFGDGELVDAPSAPSFFSPDGDNQLDMPTSTSFYRAH